LTTKACFATWIGAVLLLSVCAVEASEIPEPRDLPYPGTIRLAIDAADLDHRIFRVQETIPVANPGPMVLLYPKWLPGNHSTTGPVELLAGLVVTAGHGGPQIEWRRDSELMHAFHLDVPAGVSELELSFQYLTPTTARQGRIVMNPDNFDLQWEKALLYPAGYYARQIRVEPSLNLPAGWEFASALEGAQRVGDIVHFAPLSLEMLVDSPLYAGRYARRYELDPNPQAPVWLNVFADRPAELAATAEQLEGHRRIVREALALFGSRHYHHYDFLLAISDNRTGIGLEHHQSSENTVGAGYFTDWDGSATGRDLLAHEMTHSWNGKYRRPADLWTASYEVPMHNSLLWVYEGLTEFWGTVLTARAGLWTPEFARDALAESAALFDGGRPGRAWRDLQDTTNQPIMAYRVPQDYPSWQRNTDYYGEGALLWLDVDMKLRELSGDRRSLDDFARRFFGLDDGQLGPSTYVYEDVIRGLDAVARGDWNAFLRQRLDGHGPGGPLGGLERSGWRLVYTDEPSAYAKVDAKRAKTASFRHSLGITLGSSDGKIAEVVWDSPAFLAGVAPGMTLLAVNGRAWSADGLRDAIVAAQSGRAGVELLLRQDDLYRTIRIDYHGGLRYPHLERIEGRPDRLSALLKPRT
jgi:predicted metalloprotease with PDZ domain